MLKWYVLYSKPHAERQLANNLSRAGHEVYFPTIPVAQPRKDRPSDKPFFPGYLFVNYDLEADGLSRLIYTPGLRGVVMFGGEPAVVPAQDLIRIRAQLSRPQMWDHHGMMLQHGDPIEILKEPFHELEAIFDRRLGPGDRVRVFLRYLEWHALERKRTVRLTPLELDANLVRKKDSSR
jgi:transcriptional antiterminator RfaH